MLDNNDLSILIYFPQWNSWFKATSFFWRMINVDTGFYHVSPDVHKRLFAITMCTLWSVINPQSAGACRIYPEMVISVCSRSWMACWVVRTGIFKWPWTVYSASQQLSRVWLQVMYSVWDGMKSLRCRISSSSLRVTLLSLLRGSNLHLWPTPSSDYTISNWAVRTIRATVVTVYISADRQ